MRKSKRHDTHKKNILQNESKESFDEITFNIIGAGRVGQQLAFTMCREAGFSLSGIYNKSLAKAQTLAAQYPKSTVLKSLLQLPKANLTFITTPDDAISNVVTKLTKSSNPGIAVHFSGAYSSEILLPLKQAGWSIASLHPLRAFAENIILEDVFAGCYCVLEGDTLPCEFLKATFTHLGAKVIAIQPDKKILYHAAATMGSNAMVGLLHAASELLVESGFTSSDAKAMIESLATSTLTNIKQAPTISNALTGPIARGDVKTVAEHLKHISDPLIKTLYQISARNLLTISKHSKNKLALFDELLGAN